MKEEPDHVRRNREPETIRNSERGDLSQVPTIRHLTGQDTVDRERQGRSVVEQGDDQDHKRRQVEVVRGREDGEAVVDMDRDGTGVDGVVAYTLEDLAGTVDGVDDR